MRSSLGFHTLTLFLGLSKKDAWKLRDHFINYSKNTGLIKIFPVELRGQKNLRIVYYKGEDRGIKWMIRNNNYSQDFKSYIVEVTINPKILAGIHDYLTAATLDDMEKAIENFNLETARISPLLGSFNWYTLKRADYCINFDLEELGIHSSPEKIMDLIRRADIPPYYSEWMEYSDITHRKKSDPASF